MRFRYFLSTAMFLAGLAASANLAAQAPVSAGCDYINSSPWPVQASWIQLYLEFGADEFVVASVTSDLSTGLPVPTQTRLYVDDTLVDETGFPGTVSYRFPTSGTFNARWEVEPGNALWTIRCLASQPSLPVPGLGGLGVGLLAALMAGLALIRLNRTSGIRPGASAR